LSKRRREKRSNLPSIELEEGKEEAAPSIEKGGATMRLTGTVGEEGKEQTQIEILEGQKTET